MIYRLLSISCDPLAAETRFSAAVPWASHLIMYQGYLSISQDHVSLCSKRTSTQLQFYFFKSSFSLATGAAFRGGFNFCASFVLINTPSVAQNTHGKKQMQRDYSAPLSVLEPEGAEL